MTWLDFTALALAASGVVDVWKNGSIFALPRAIAADAAEMDAVQDRRTLRGTLGELLTCEFCLSHHTPWLLAVLFFLPALFVTGPWAFILKLPVYSLAATRLGWLLNAVVPPEAQYARANSDEDDDDDNPNADTGYTAPTA